MSSEPSEEEVSLYQDLLRVEVEKFQNSKKSKNNQNRIFRDALLDTNDIDNIIKKYSTDGSYLFQNLLNKRMIMKYDGKYRTAHMDLLAKVAFIRSFPNSPPYPLEFDIMLYEEPYPDFGSVRIDDLIKIIDEKLARDGLDEKRRILIRDIIRNLLDEIDVDGLSSFQYYIIQKILNTNLIYIPLVAPTATGKTIIFTIPALVYLLESVLKGEEPINVLFIYPRKALAKDQMEKLILYLYVINSKMPADKKISIGLEDGDTPKEIKQGEKYRGFKCPKCKVGNLIYGSNGGIQCDNGGCRATYDFIIATKDDIKKFPPNILITNLWTFYRRLLNKDTVNRYRNVKYLVLDEVHAYDGILYSHLKYTLRLLFSLKKLTGSAPIEKIIFSSATIPNFRDFISKLVCSRGTNCIPPTEIKSYVEFYEENKSKVSKKRLILYEFLLPNVEKSVETLTEEAAIAALAWLKEHEFKSILFADSISGTSTLYQYIVNTILGERKAREIRDHLCYANDTDEYYWPYLSKFSYVCKDEKHLEKLAKELREGMDVHHAIFSLEERARKEEEFKKNKNKAMLLSTSTLELGIDIGDVALVIQHKLPLSREGFIQRVGRAGRSNNTYRIATGIVVLQSTPFTSLYMFNRELRESLINIDYKSISNSLDFVNPQIALQHMLSYLLMKRALKGNKTCVDDRSKLEECKEIANELINDIDNNFDHYIKEIGDELDINIDKNKNDIRNLIKRIKTLYNHEGNDECHKIAEELYGSIKKLLNDYNEDYLQLENLLNEDSSIKKHMSMKEIESMWQIINYVGDSMDIISDDISEIDNIESKLRGKSEELRSYLDKLEKIRNELHNSQIGGLSEKMKIYEATWNIQEIEDKLQHILRNIEKTEKLESIIMKLGSIKRSAST
ncbi:DEAD/DEAH box helicase [Sulfolobus sp. E11-6]|uniref:DEAD/DEAH box helicase n=1 Tax=Sulfolobus sp. E11-6 TaxID=2663020 RepID=UPI001295FDCF|nr:DEAD/DEAH box helicase [Sulfolobus sp. E11-6]QGA69058.1 DEAD/DEAH box helicase [Sulfolobus sp. E11-6]